jgi:uncharacterized protein
MSDLKPVDVIQKIYAAFGRKDLEAMLAMMADNVTWVVRGPNSVRYFGEFSGRDGVRRWSQTLRETVQIEKLDVAHIVADGEHVVVIGDFTATATATGRRYWTRFVHVWQVRGQLAVAFEDFLDTAAVVAAHQP